MIRPPVVACILSRNRGRRRHRGNPLRGRCAVRWLTQAATPARLGTFSRAMMLLTWISAVFSLMPSARPICRLVPPGGDQRGDLGLPRCQVDAARPGRRWRGDARRRGRATAGAAGSAAGVLRVVGGGAAESRDRRAARRREPCAPASVGVRRTEPPWLCGGAEQARPAAAHCPRSTRDLGQRLEALRTAAPITDPSCNDSDGRAGGRPRPPRRGRAARWRAPRADSRDRPVVVEVLEVGQRLAQQRLGDRSSTASCASTTSSPRSYADHAVPRTLPALGVDRAGRAVVIGGLGRSRPARAPHGRGTTVAIACRRSSPRARLSSRPPAGPPRPGRTRRDRARPPRPR